MRAIRALALAAAVFAAACDDDDAPVVVTPDGGASLAGADAATDGGAGPDGGPVAIPLTAWVDDLVMHFGPMSAPDTVDDKVIMDTEDPAAFDPLLTQ